MSEIAELIREYCSILDEEQKLEERKTELRRKILDGLTSENLKRSRSPFGTAERMTRFTLNPIRPEVLGLLDSEDLFSFAHFTAPKVKSLLVPKYGRERLLSLFDIQRVEYLLVKRPETHR
jgi:hypothetical protein